MTRKSTRGHAESGKDELVPVRMASTECSGMLHFGQGRGCPNTLLARAHFREA
jgi:hypothetical protein